MPESSKTKGMCALTLTEQPEEMSLRAPKGRQFKAREWHNVASLLN